MTVAEPTDPPAGPKRRAALRPAIVVAILAAAALILWLLLRPGGTRSEERFTGYVVSDDIYMASPVAGTLTAVSVRRGQAVAAGDPLFRVDPTVRAAETDRARAIIAANRAGVGQQQAGLARARADLAASDADAARYGAELRRLVAAQRDKPGSVAQLDIDQARASYDAALRRADAARTALGSANSAIAAAEAQVDQARAGLTSAERELADLSPAAPRAGRIGDVMYKPGESVAANVPVVSIIPDGEVKVRFYVPEGLVSGYRPGRRVAIACDGCPSGMSATVDFVASEPEYTPPVIYSLDARQKLVFLVEAVPSKPAALVPGQPIDVTPAAGTPPRR
jgi:HlyD family secretion protein